MPGGEDEGLNAPTPETAPDAASEFDSDEDFDAVMADLPEAEPQAPAPLNPFARDPAERSSGDDLAGLVERLTRQGAPEPEVPRADPNAGIDAGTPDAVRERFPIGLPVTASEAITSSSDRAPRAGKVERIERGVDRQTGRPHTTVHVRMDESGRVERFRVKDNGFIDRDLLRPVRAEDAPPEFEGYVDPMARERGRRGGNRAALIRRVERGEQRSAAEGDEYEEYMASAGQARRDMRDRMAERGWVTDAQYNALRKAEASDGEITPGRASGVNRATLDGLVESGHLEAVGRGARPKAYRLTDTGRDKIGPRAADVPEPETPLTDMSMEELEAYHDRLVSARDRVPQTREGAAQNEALIARRQEARGEMHERSVREMDARQQARNGSVNAGRTRSGGAAVPPVGSVDPASGTTRGTAKALGLADGDRVLYHGGGTVSGQPSAEGRELTVRRGRRGITLVDDDGKTVVSPAPATVMWARKLDQPAAQDEPEPPAPARPIDRVRATSGRERTAVLRGLSDGEIGDLMRDVAMDRDAPDRQSLIGVINRENTRRSNEAQAARDAERAASQAASVAEKRDADASLAQRVAGMETITPGGMNMGATMASALQRAARSGGSTYVILDRRNSRRPRIFDAPPAPGRMLDGSMTEVRADGSMIHHTYTKSVMGGGWNHTDEKAVAPGSMVNQAGPYIERHATRAERDAAEPEPFRPLTMDGGPTPADHVDTSGLSGGARADAHRTLQAIASVHRVEGMNRIMAEMEEAGADRGGSYRPDQDADRITINDDTATPLLDFAHEYGHAIDRHQLVSPTLPLYGSQSVGVALPDAPLHQKPEAQAMKRMLDAIKASETFKHGRRQKGTLPSYVEYWSQDHELWARAYSQFIAARSGDEKLMADLRRMQAGDQRREGYVPMQWPDDEFAPIGAAIEDVLRARGWMD